MRDRERGGGGRERRGEERWRDQERVRDRETQRGSKFSSHDLSGILTVADETDVYWRIITQDFYMSKEKVPKFFSSVSTTFRKKKKLTKDKSMEPLSSGFEVIAK